ncbi:MAG TPA: hypothetical protein VN695_07575 [Streptosporangiaceae bacterium]|nr:hypothetical protein [Streptosporangiaceae bacterium]
MLARPAHFGHGVTDRPQFGLDIALPGASQYVPGFIAPSDLTSHLGVCGTKIMLIASTTPGIAPMPSIHRQLSGAL